MPGQDFIMNGRDFHDDKPNLNSELSRCSCWQVGIFIVTGKGSHDDRSRLLG